MDKPPQFPKTQLNNMTTETNHFGETSMGNSHVPTWNAMTLISFLHRP